MIRNKNRLLVLLILLLANMTPSFAASIKKPTQSSLFTQETHLILRPIQDLLKSIGFSKQNKLAQKNNNIRDYSPDDSASLSEIALQHIPQLVNITRDAADFKGMQTKEIYQLALTHQILPAFIDPGFTTQVYCIDGVAVGFISYTIFSASESWHQYTVHDYYPNTLYAEIAYLAVHNEYQKNGIGSALLQAALNDCSARSVRNITLLTTGDIKNNILLSRFYHSFGFKIIRSSSETVDTKWCKN